MPDPTPAAATTPAKCPNCSADRKEGAVYCGACGVKFTGGGAADVGLEERVAALETTHKALSPVARLVERLKARGIDPDQVGDEKLDFLAGFAKSGGAGLFDQVKRNMGVLFPGSGLGKSRASKTEAPPAPPAKAGKR